MQRSSPHLNKTQEFRALKQILQYNVIKITNVTLAIKTMTAHLKERRQHQTRKREVWRPAPWIGELWQDDSASWIDTAVPPARHSQGQVRVTGVKYVVVPSRCESR